MDALRIALWLRTSLLSIVAVVFISAPLAAQQRQQSAVEKLADAIGEALKAATGTAKPKRRPNVVPMQQVQPVQQVPPPAANEVKEREARLQRYSKTMQAWITQQGDLNPDQVQQLSTMMERVIESSQNRFRQAPRAAQQRNQQLSDYFPIRFTADKGAAREIQVLLPISRIKDVQLTAEQQQRLTQAAAERQEFLEEANVDYVLNMLDAELHFTIDQRDRIAPSIAKLIDRDASCFSFQPQTYYFPQTSIAKTIRPGKHLEVLTKAQRDRASDLASVGSGSYNSEQYILFQSTEGIDTWQDKLTDVTVEQRKRLSRAVHVRVAFHEVSQGLSEKEVHYLRVAGKGAVEEVIAAWKEQSRRQLKSYEDQVARFNGNFSFGLSVADVHKLEANKIWKHAVESLTTKDSDATAKRDAARLDATARFVVAMLDRELWLNSDQRHILVEAVRKELPDPDYRISNSRYYGEITLMCIPLFKLSKTQLTVLNPAQKQVWETMQSLFQWDGNFVRVQMRNGGQISFSLPR